MFSLINPPLRHCSQHVYTHRLAWRNVQSLGAWFADESILQLDAGERAPGHHRVVPSASAIRVELPRRQAGGNIQSKR